MKHESKGEGGGEGDGEGEGQDESESESEGCEKLMGGGQGCLLELTCLPLLYFGARGSNH